MSVARFLGDYWLQSGSILQNAIGYSIHSKLGFDCCRKIRRYCLSFKSAADHDKTKGNFTVCNMVHINGLLRPHVLLFQSGKSWPGFSWNNYARMVYYITGLALFEVIPLIIIIILYSCIMRVLSKRPKPNCPTRCNSKQNRHNQNKTIMRIFKSIVLAYFISYSFYCIYLFLKITSPDLFIKDRCKLIFGFAFFVLPSFSTAINPVILFTFSTNFRQALPHLWPLKRNNRHALKLKTHRRAMAMRIPQQN